MQSIESVHLNGSHLSTSCLFQCLPSVESISTRDHKNDTLILSFVYVHFYVVDATRIVRSSKILFTHREIHMLPYCLFKSGGFEV